MTLYCRNPPLIYLHIPKCGGNSVKEALGIILRTGQAKHMDAFEAMDTWPELWPEAYKFATVRNPFDRLVSIWAFSTKGLEKKQTRGVMAKMYRATKDEHREFFENLSFVDWVKWVDEKNWNHFGDAPILQELQSSWLHKDVEVFKLEELDKLEEWFLKVVGVEVIFGHSHKSKRAESYRIYYDDEIRKLIETYQKPDLERYGYEF